MALLLFLIEDFKEIDKLLDEYSGYDKFNAEQIRLMVKIQIKNNYSMFNYQLNNILMNDNCYFVEILKLKFNEDKKDKSVI